MDSRNRQKLEDLVDNFKKDIKKECGDEVYQAVRDSIGSQSKQDRVQNTSRGQLGHAAKESQHFRPNFQEFKVNKQGLILTPRMVLPPGVEFSKQIHRADWERRHVRLTKRILNPEGALTENGLGIRAGPGQPFPDISRHPVGHWPADKFRFPRDAGSKAGYLNMTLMLEAVAVASGRRDPRICETCPGGIDGMCTVSSIWCKVPRFFDLVRGYPYPYKWEGSDEVEILEMPEWYPDDHWYLDLCS